ncbi:MAG: trans-2-enoyl-CoA reductase family protein [Verrucomicrobium sp.]|nr:trans-2-enoyl-CoA reductase family protein [Verrucomicrobium sp.]
MILRPRIRGFICLTTHPDGCAAHVRQQIDVVKKGGPLPGVPKRVLVIGSSTGYGLAARIAAAFGGGAATLGVFHAKAPEADRTTSPGWYNTVAFEREAHAAGLYAKEVHGDAFGDDVKAQVVAKIKEDWGQVDHVVYSLAAPRRVDPRTGQTSKSCLKPIGAPYTAKTLDTDRLRVHEITIEPANEQEIAETTAVMGGDDWERWIDALEQGGVLAPGATTLAYSYIGPVLTFPIYRNGTIGRAKEDLETTAARLRKKLDARIVVSKALVTQASSAIPVVSLYLSLLYKVMKEKGLHEGCIEQMRRLYAEVLPAKSYDEAGRIRIDDWEMRPDVQAEVEKLWPQASTENVKEISDVAGTQAEFLRLFGFGLPGLDYEAESDPLLMEGKPATLAH